MDIRQLKEKKYSDGSIFTISTEEILSRYKNNNAKAQADYIKTQIENQLDGDVERQRLVELITNKLNTNRQRSGKNGNLLPRAKEGVSLSTEALDNAVSAFELALKNYETVQAEVIKELAKKRSTETNRLNKARGDLAEYFVAAALAITQYSNSSVAKVVDDLFNSTGSIKVTGDTPAKHGGSIDGITYNISSKGKADVKFVYTNEKLENELLGISVKNYQNIKRNISLYGEANLMGLLGAWNDENSALAFLHSLLFKKRTDIREKGERIMGIQSLMGGAVNLDQGEDTSQFFVLFNKKEVKVIHLPSFLSEQFGNKQFLNKELFSIQYLPRLSTIKNRGRDLDKTVDEVFNDVKTTISFKSKAIASLNNFAN